MEMALQVEVFPTDLGRCVDFYVRVLRFEVVEDKRGDPAPYVSFRRGSARIGASPAWTTTDPSARAVPQGAEVVLEVDDVAAERDHIVASGWSLASNLRARPWGLEDFRLYDPDGYYIRITTRR
jgi:predicted enzyme related to lactoylglutathione lyase